IGFRSERWLRFRKREQPVDAVAASEFESRTNRSRSGSPGSCEGKSFGGDQSRSEDRQLLRTRVGRFVERELADRRRRASNDESGEAFCVCDDDLFERLLPERRDGFACRDVDEGRGRRRSCVGLNRNDAASRSIKAQRRVLLDAIRGEWFEKPAADHRRGGRQSKGIRHKQGRSSDMGITRRSSDAASIELFRYPMAVLSKADQW